jgi:hypothetical protein
MINLSTAGHQVGDSNGVPLEWKSEVLSLEPPCLAKRCLVSEYYSHLKRDAVYSGRTVPTFQGMLQHSSSQTMVECQGGKKNSDSFRQCFQRC